MALLFFVFRLSSCLGFSSPPAWSVVWPLVWLVWSVSCRSPIVGMRGGPNGSARVQLFPRYCWCDSECTMQLFAASTHLALALDISVCLCCNSPNPGCDPRHCSRNTSVSVSFPMIRFH
ncbi:uncharacterized protein BJ171DRAFT_491339 [Polychytrium aggregatum]|uniref:uncharacterized protein n=1 Tax=Polychytrium aggregatum TaxID=110093 RepID=UPI0022FEDE1B|nr:uncharacterized protein BJ171DRAFT_491339 [Polychytrium aggregatum]KAI9207737.1 hypothetical protein BJ171DRAFT_491339 [Polychytrium aggregatum]